MNLWTDSKINSLSPAQRTAVQSRAQAAGQSPADYLNGIGAGLSVVQDYEKQDAEADAKFFAPFFRLSLQFPPELRIERALQIREDAAGLRLDTSEVDALIAQFP